MRVKFTVSLLSESEQTMTPVWRQNTKYNSKLSSDEFLKFTRQKVSAQSIFNGETLAGRKIHEKIVTIQS